VTIDGPAAVSKLDPSLLRSDGETSVIVRLKDPSLAESGKSGDAAQAAHVRDLERKQDTFLAKAEREGAENLGQTQRVLNAVFISADTDTLLELAEDPNVERMTPAGVYQLAVDSETQLDETVDYIGGTAVHNAGEDGKGVKVAVLDSGIDYTHANLGGPGTPEAYAAATANATSRDGVFPTAKVVGGWDFVGSTWPNTPEAPDEDPIDDGPEAGHGTHVAHIIGGLPSEAFPHGGVAPGVDLYAVKVCSSVSTSCSGIALIQGMDFAVDPNQDGKTKDHVDVINMSLGAPYGQPFDDDLSQAVDGATALGVLTVAAAGNDSDKPFISSSPAAAPTAISVAQTQVPSATVPALTILQPANIAGIIEDVAFQPWSVPPTAVIEAPMQYGNGAGGNLDGCAPFPAGSLAGRIVLVDRGTCTFSAKISNISQGGGLAGIIGLIAPGVPFAGGDGGERPIDIPGYMIDQATSNRIKGALRSGAVVIMQIDPAGLPAVGQLVGSSARGPQFEDYRIKPEIGAPGASVSAIAGTGSETGPFGGTSGATPMVSGSAALLIAGFDNHKGKGARMTPLEVKSLLMNTAETEVDTSPFDPDAPITRIGAGEVRVDQAFGADAVAWVQGNDGASLSFGHVDVPGTVTLTKTVELKNYANERTTYQVSASFRKADDEENGAVSIEVPATVQLKPGLGRTTKFDVSITIDGSLLRGNAMNSGSEGANPDALTLNEYDGYITLDAGDDRPITIPWQVLPRKAAEVSASSASFPNGGATIELANRGAGVAQNDAYALVAVDEDLPPGGPGEQSPTPDIRGVGVNTFLVGPGFCSADPSFVWAFAFDSWERHAHANFPATMWLDLDTDQDGTPDYAVFNADVAGLAQAADGRTLTWVFEWTDYPDEIGNGEAFFFAEHATVTGNYVLLLCGEQIGMNQDDLFTPVDVEAFAFDFYFGGPGDEVDPFTISPFGERFFAQVGDIPGNGTGSMRIFDFGTGSDANLGILLFTNGDRGANNHGGATDETEALYFMLE
jgi:subtilisin family serine protease